MTISFDLEAFADARNRDRRTGIEQGIARRVEAIERSQRNAAGIDSKLDRRSGWDRQPGFFTVDDDRNLYLLRCRPGTGT
ncbi:MAG: hypothetical protein P8Z41_11840 [Anaerolineales bacterium]